ncbi:MAG: hypothetical protein AB7J46_06215 [Candidatus Altimarinota bacterium]
MSFIPVLGVALVLLLSARQLKKYLSPPESPVGTYLKEEEFNHILGRVGRQGDTETIIE